MGKGKKFDAAEKHFEKKRIELDKEIKYLQGRVSEQNSIITKQTGTIIELTAENRQLHEWIERLLEYTELSQEDIKTACERDKRICAALSYIEQFGKFGAFI